MPFDLQQDAKAIVSSSINDIFQREDSNLYGDSPYVALAYRQDQRCFLTFTGVYPIALTDSGDLSEGLRLWSAFGNYLKETSRGDPEEALRFKMRYLIFPNIMNESMISESKIPGFLLVSLGDKPDCEYRNNKMGEIDLAAAGLIQSGLTLGEKPVWIKTNYPFCRRPGFRPGGFDNQSLVELVDGLEQERSFSTQTKVLA